MKEHNKTPEKELNDEEVTTYVMQSSKHVIRMLTELIQLGRKMKKEMKAIQNKIKENIQGTNSEGKETRTQINDLEQKEEINIHPEQNEQTKIFKNEKRLKNLWNDFKCSNIQIITVPEEEQEQEIENLFVWIMKENFPNLAKEIDFQEVQEAQTVPKKLDPRSSNPETLRERATLHKNREILFLIKMCW